MVKFYSFDYRTKNSKLNKEFVSFYRKNTYAYEGDRLLSSDGYTNDFTQYEIDIPRNRFTKSLNLRDKNKIIVATEENEKLLRHNMKKYFNFSAGIDFSKVKSKLEDYKYALILWSSKGLKVTKKIVKNNEPKSSSTRAFIKSLRNPRGAFSSKPTLEKLDSCGVLIVRQMTEFDKIYNELELYQKKVKHWAWWVWPTEREGYSEPSIQGVKSSIEKNKIPDLLEMTDTEKWTEILNLISDLIEKNKSVDKIIPVVDHGRMKAFFDLFLNNKVAGYKDFFKAVERQKNLFCAFIH